MIPYRTVVISFSSRVTNPAIHSTNQCYYETIFCNRSKQPPLTPRSFAFAPDYPSSSLPRGEGKRGGGDEMRLK